MHFVVVERLARRQHGTVSWSQLRAAGVSAAMIKTMAGAGRLIRVHRGVYAVCDPALIPLAAEAAAVLAVGPRAVLGHRTAAALWSLGPARPPEVDVIVLGANAKPRAGLRLHRIGHLDRREITRRERLPVTTPARTVIDFAGEATAAEVEHAISEARALNLITDAKLEAALNRAPITHPGAAKVRALLRRQVGRVITRSERERKLLKLLEAAGLPKPLVNHWLHGYLTDFYWPEHQLILEFDGFQTHGGRRKFESDRRRDQVNAARGIQTMRATWLQLEQEPVALVVRVGQALAVRTGPPGPRDVERSETPTGGFAPRSAAAPPG